MKLFIVATFVALAVADKLDNTYLPPSSSRTAGGNGQFLATPFGGKSSFGGSSFGSKSSFGGSSFGGSSGFGAQSGFKSSGFGGASGASNFGKSSFGASSGFAKSSFGAPGFAAQAGVHSHAAPAPQYGAPSGARGYSGNNGPQINILRFNNDNNGDGSYQFDFETENKISAQEAGQPKNVGGEEPTVVQGSYSYTSPEGQVITVNYVSDENGFQPIGDHLPTSPPIPEAILKSIQENAARGDHGDDGSYSGGNSGSYSGSHSGSHSGFQSGSHSGSFQGSHSGNGGVQFNSFNSQAASRQYLAPNKPSFNNQQGGYKY